jgi:hypothetical protein
MSHGTCTQGNRINSQLLVVGSQTANLTTDLSFGHNLCFKHPNGWCEPILDVYVPKKFWWYKEHLKPLRFDPWNRPLKIRESTGTPTPKVEPLGGVRVHSLTPFHTLRNMLCDSQLPFWLATLRTYTIINMSYTPTMGSIDCSTPSSNSTCVKYLQMLTHVIVTFVVIWFFASISLHNYLLLEGKLE